MKFCHFFGFPVNICSLTFEVPFWEIYIVFKYFRSSNFKGLVLKCEKEFQQWTETMDSICFWVIVPAHNSVVENRVALVWENCCGLFSPDNGTLQNRALSTHSPLVHHSFCHPLNQTWAGTIDFSVVMVKRF